MGTRTAPRDIAITIAQGQDTLCDSPIVFFRKTQENGKGVQFVVLRKVSLPECGTNDVSLHLFGAFA